MPVREVAFELECFEWADERLEVAGRWKGLAGRRLNRPVLTVETEGGRRKHLVAMPGGHFGAAEESWRAAFDWPGDPAEITGAELEVGGKIVVDLPLPDRKRRRRRRHSTQDTGDELLRSEIVALRGQVERLRSELAGRERENMQLREQIDEHEDGERPVSEPGAATVEIGPPVAPPREDLSAELARLEAERDHTRAELSAEVERLHVERDQTRAELSAEVERLHAERDRMRLEIERLEGEKNHARADVDDLREAFADAAAEAEEVRDRHHAEVAALREELDAERATVARLSAKLAAGPEIPPPRTPSGRRRAPWAVVQRPDSEEQDRPVDEDRFAAAFAGDDGPEPPVSAGAEPPDSAAATDPSAAAAANEPGSAAATDPSAAAAANEPASAADAGPSASAADAGPSASTADTDLSASAADSDLSASAADTDPSASAGDTVAAGEAPASGAGGDAAGVGEAGERPLEGDEAGAPAEDDVEARNEAARRAAAAAPPTQPLTPVPAEDSLPAIASVPDVVDPPGPLRAGARPAAQPGVEDGARPSRIPAWLRAGRGEREDAEEERSVGPVFQAVKDRVEGLFASNGHADAEDEPDDAYPRVPGPRRSAAAARARAGATVAARRSPAELWALRVLAALLVAVLLLAFLLILTSIA